MMSVAAEGAGGVTKGIEITMKSTDQKMGKRGVFKIDGGIVISLKQVTAEELTKESAAGDASDNRVL